MLDGSSKGGAAPADMETEPSVGQVGRAWGKDCEDVPCGAWRIIHRDPTDIGLRALVGIRNGGHCPRFYMRQGAEIKHHYSLPK